MQKQNTKISNQVGCCSLTTKISLPTKNKQQVGIWIQIRIWIKICVKMHLMFIIAEYSRNVFL